MDINEILISDQALSNIDNGTWVDELAEAPGVRLLVTGLRAKSARALMEKLQTKARLKNRGRVLNDDQISMVTREVLAEVVLKGWEGLKDKGADVPYDKALAKKWLLSRNGEKFVALVIEAALRVDGQADEFVEDVEKN